MPHIDDNLFILLIVLIGILVLIFPWLRDRAGDVYDRFFVDAREHERKLELQRAAQNSK